MSAHQKESTLGTVHTLKKVMHVALDMAFAMPPSRFGLQGLLSLTIDPQPQQPLQTVCLTSVSKFWNAA